MKKYSLILVFLFSLGLLTLSGCTKEEDIQLFETKKTLLVESFSDATDNTDLNTTGWVNYAQAGTKKWTEQVYSGNGYAEFTSFSSGQASNIAWLISPPIDMDKQEGETLVFQSAHAFLTTTENSLELMVSTDFDGNVANFNQANWINIPVTVPTPSNDFYEFVNSGAVDLSQFKGNLRFAFKVKGSGTNTSLDATYQIDNIRVFY